jgi:hypothetical protein
VSPLFSDSVHRMRSIFSDFRKRCNLLSGLSSRRVDQVRNFAVALCSKSEAIGQTEALHLALGPLCLGHHLLFFFGSDASFKLPGLRSGGRFAVARRPPRLPTNCAKAPRAFSPRPPPPVSWRSWLLWRLSSLRDALGPSPSRMGQGCSGHSLPRACAEHLITLLGDAFLGIPIPQLVPGWHQPQVRSDRAALLEAVGVLQGEHERQSAVSGPIPST